MLRRAEIGLRDGLCKFLAPFFYNNASDCSFAFVAGNRQTDCDRKYLIQQRIST